MDLKFLSQSQLFKGIDRNDIPEIFQILQYQSKIYIKNEYIYYYGENVTELGIILSGEVIIEQNDKNGSRNIISTITSGQMFAEAYAFAPDSKIMVNVIATEKSEILFLNAERITNIHNSKTIPLLKNLIEIMALKNLNLTRKISSVTPRTIRERIMFYLSQQCLVYGTNRFEISFNRQQLADYLCVDRSALSGELSKMKKDGIINYNKNSFECSPDFFDADSNNFH